MRIDKFLKVSRIIKRRTVAKTSADSNRVLVNGKAVKPSYEVKLGDTIEVKFGDKTATFEVISFSVKEEMIKII